MASPAVLVDARQIPIGAHALSFHASPEEAADQAAGFLDGAPQEQAARFWVPDDRTAKVYSDVTARQSPEHVGCIAILPTEQVEPVDGKLRPIAEIREYIRAHPEGVTAAAGTISSYLTDENVPAHVEYESWFDAQERDNSRFLCPYDLRRVPPEAAPQLMHDLGAHHSHVVLSHSDEPGALLLELFIFDSVQEIPPLLHQTLGWAVANDLVRTNGADMPLTLTPGGESAVRDWGERSSVDY